MFLLRSDVLFLLCSRLVRKKFLVNKGLIPTRNPLTDDRELAAVEDAQHLLELAPAPQHLTAQSVDGILALPVGKCGFLLDPPGRAFGMAPEDCEGGDVASEADRIVAGLSGNHQPAIDIENGLQLALLESDHWIGRRLARRELGH